MGIYTKIIQDSITGIYRTNAANKILQFIKRIRNESDMDQARRFLIELMQNARDLAYKTPEGDTEPVSVRIRLSDTELEFSHNGKVFSVKDILSIIYQVSSKKPGEGIGQFGTGFMSTYQLSEKVELTSYLKNGENPYLPFTVCLDRSGCSKEEILEAIEASMDQLVMADESAEGVLEENFDRSGYNTSFLYHLDQEKSREIAKTGMEEILILTGESRAYSDVKYIGEAVKIARKYFRNIGIEIYPVNVDEYKYLHECGVDYVTVFQETYNTDKYETLHLMGHKRVWPYRFDAQERALMGGMRGAGFSALLGLDDFRKDALATALHVYYINRKYPYAELSLSCPRLRPIVNNDKINPRDVGEKELCQVLCAYRIFLPFAGITVSSRESAAFRNGITKICATKVSAGVSTGIGDHEEKYEGKEDADVGDEQFEINDGRSFASMYEDMEKGGLQPVLNDYIYV